MSQEYQIAIASDWEYDWDFVRYLEDFARKDNISTYLIWPYNLRETIEKVKHGAIKFSFLYDRASDTSPDFLELQNLIIQQNIPVFDKWEALKPAADKAIMHIQFEQKGINTPYTIIIPSFKTQENLILSDKEFRRLGNPFVTKPANTSGGGEGVVKKTYTMDDILHARQTFSFEKYLLQEKILPFETDGKRFWFRGFFTCGLVQAAWWNDLTHVYEILSDDEVKKYNLQPLFEKVRKIADVCKLNFFSTEIAVDHHGKFITVDYVNEVCDMRIKSQHYDGVPDELVISIARQIISYASDTINKT